MKKRISSIIITMAICLSTIIIPSHIAYAMPKTGHQGIFMKDGVFISVSFYTGIESNGPIGVVNHVTEPYMDNYAHVQYGTYQELGKIYQNEEKYIIKSEYHDKHRYIDFKKGGICISNEIIDCYDGEYIQVSNVGANVSPDMIWLSIPKRTEKTIVNAYISELELFDWGKSSYTIYDIDKDGIYELIVHCEYGYEVFTYMYDEAVLLDTSNHTEPPEGSENCKWLCTNDYSLLDSLQPWKVIKVIIDDTELSFDQPPIIENDRVMVPIRAIFEALGYTVEWYGDTQTAVANKGNNTITVQINNPKISYNRGTYLCDVSPKIVSGRTLVPVRAIAESAGCNVQWDGKTKTVYINDDYEIPKAAPEI